jgi:exodeoxyribonuclease VII small subunit
LDSTEISELSFEDAFRRLEDTVAQLESGGLTIDDLVSRFEQGMKLVALCRLRLDSARARLSRLVQNDEDSEDESAQEAESLDV